MYSNFILNLRKVHQINTWPRNPSNNFTLKNSLFGTVKLTRNADKSKSIENSQGIAFDGENSWSFVNDFCRNVVIFGANNSSSSHTDNRKNNFLREGPNNILIIALLQQKKIKF